MNSKFDHSFFSFRNMIILSIIVIFIYIFLLNLFKSDESIRILFSDVSSLLIEIGVVIYLIYAAKYSAIMGRRVKIAWLLFALAAFSYFLGDVIWTLLEIVLNSTPFPSVADIFYLAFYPIFALAIYYLPRTPLKKNEEFKLFMDMLIITLTVSLIFLIFLIMPAFEMNSEIFESIISVAYVIGDLILLFALVRLMFLSFKDVSLGPLLFIGLGIFVQIISDCIYSFQSTHGTYVSGGLLDAGWVISFILIGLAAFLQIKHVKYGYDPFIKYPIPIKINFPTYIPIILVILTYSVIIWANENQMISNFFYAEVGGGIIILLILIRQAFTINENRNLYISAKNEISQREKIEKNLIKSRKHFKKIFDNSPIGIFHSSIEGKFIEVNKALADMLKYESPEELISLVNRDNISNIYVDKGKRSRIIEEAQKDSLWHFYENDFYSKDGSIMTSELSFRLVRDDKDIPKYLEGFIVDITERKKAENYMKNSLKEKELLLKEIHHRVKNNLQIITSMLDLQKYFVDQEETINILTESQNRVKSMATIHEMLYQSTDLININFSDYIYNLVSELCYTYSLKYKIKPIIDVGEIFLNIETAIPCGLIINELVSNSLKYAFPDHREGVIKIELKEEDGELTLKVSDNGIGFPEDLDYKDVKTSLGLKLVNMLIDQIDGTIDLDRSKGTEFIIKFRELEYKKRF